MALLLAVTLLSLPPTFRYIRWNARAKATGSLPSKDEIATLRRYLWAEAGLLAAVPVFAALMARGI
jgi:putative membrane protein